jgi:hypothetical protein
MKSENCWQKQDCRLCGGRNLEMVLDLPSTPPANEFLKVPAEQEIYPLKVNLCRDCGHAQLSHVVNPKILFDHYLYVSGTSKVFTDHFTNYAAKLKKQFLSAPTDFVCEIGSNDGTLLKNFKEFRILGIEPAKGIADRANQEGIPTVNDYFDFDVSEKIQQEEGKASVIIANNVMAHIDKLGDVVDAIKELMAERGVFAMEVQYLGDLIAGGLFDMIYFEHLDYHALTPLVSFFDAHELKLFDVERVSTHGGSIRCFIGHKNDEDKKITTTLTDLLREEKLKSLNSNEPWVHLKNLIDSAKTEIVKIISEFKLSGKKIIAYGAPAKLTTLFYAFGLTKNMIDYVVDDSPFKVSRYTPGEHIPIHESKIIYDQVTKPDVILISAWNFSESIIKAHSSLRDVIWITPLPHLLITKT